MAGSTPRIHERNVNGTPYTVETSQHEHGISIVVSVPGMAPEEENDRTFASEDEALVAGEEIARFLLRKRKD
jgi:hypothetical protein